MTRIKRIAPVLAALALVLAAAGSSSAQSSCSTPTINHLSARQWIFANGQGYFQAFVTAYGPQPLLTPTIAVNGFPITGLAVQTFPIPGDPTMPNYTLFWFTKMAIALSPLDILGTTVTETPSGNSAGVTVPCRQWGSPAGSTYCFGVPTPSP